MRAAGPSSGGTSPSAGATSETSASELETTVHAPGAVTSIEYVAFRSGWSKQANTRLASAVSNWEYRYVCSSAGSVKRCRPSPVVV